MGKNNAFFNLWGNYGETIGYVNTSKCNSITMEQVITTVNEIVSDKITEELNIEEKDDKLYVGGKEVMTDNYVKSGTYNGDGTVTLQMGEDKTATIEDLPKPMSNEDIENIVK